MGSHLRWRELRHKGSPETLASARADLDRAVRVEELREQFDATEQQAWKLFAAERREIPIDRVEVEA